MTDNIDYSLHYSFWHDGTPSHVQATVAADLDKIRRHNLHVDRGRALDVGAGAGYFVSALGRAGYAAEGIERSVEQCQLARDSGLLVTHCADELSFLSSHEQQFDLISLIDVLEHVPISEQPGLLIACYRALRPGGRLVVQTPNAASPVASSWQYIDWTHVTAFTYFSLRFLLLNAGFSASELDFRDPDRGLGWRRIKPARILRAVTRVWFRLVMLAEYGFRSRESRVRLDLNHFVVATRAA